MDGLHGALNEQAHGRINHGGRRPKIAIKFYSVELDRTKAKASVIADSVVDAITSRQKLACRSALVPAPSRHASIQHYVSCESCHDERSWPADRRWCQLLHDMHLDNIMFHVSHAMMKGTGLQIGAGAM